MKDESKNDLVETLFKVARQMKDEMSFSNDLIHLSILQIQALFFLNKNKKVSMSDIAAYFHTELPSATSLLNKLHEQKLVERHEDKEDRRLVMITLTEKGKTLLKEAMCVRKKKLEKILLYLSEKQRLDLLNILETLNSKLQNKNED